MAPILEENRIILKGPTDSQAHSRMDRPKYIAHNNTAYLTVLTGARDNQLHCGKLGIRQDHPRSQIDIIFLMSGSPLEV